MRIRDVTRMWAQIVHHTGRDTYTDEEWQLSYEEFLKCMHTPTQPYIRVENIDNLIALLGSPKKHKKNGRPGKLKQEEDSNNVNNDESMDELEPLSNWRKRIKLETERRSSQDTLSPRTAKRLSKSRIANERNEIAEEQPGLQNTVKEEEQEPLDQQVDKQKNRKEKGQGKEDQEIKPKSVKTKHNNQKTQQKNTKKETSVNRQAKAIDLKTKAEKKSLQKKQTRVLDAVPIKPNSNQEQNSVKSKRGRKRKETSNSNTNSNSKPINAIPNAHMPPTAINLIRQNTSSTSQSSNQTTEELAEDLKITRNEELEQNDCKSVPSESSEFNLFVETPIDETDLKEQLIEDIMQSRPLNSYQDISLLLTQDNNTELLIDTQDNQNSDTVSVTNNDEEIERYLQCCSSKTPSEIDHDISDTSNFFNNIPNLTKEALHTPLELDAMIEDVLNYDYDDDDDDALSVTTSWDGEDIESLPNKAKKTEPQPKEDVFKPMPAAAMKKQTSELRSFRIPKQTERIEAAVEAKSELAKAETVENQLNVEKVGKEAKPKQRLKLNKLEQQNVCQKLPEKINSIQSVAASEVQLTEAAKLPEKSKEMSLKLTKPEQLNKTANRQLKQPKQPQTNNWLPRSNCQASIQNSSNGKPIFAPPYRVPVESTAVFPIIPSRNGIYNCKTTIFGIKCWSYLNGRCEKLNCNHRLGDIGDVKRRLDPMKKSQLIGAYSFILRHGILFKVYFLLFAEIFGSRSMLNQLIQMVEDCALYLAYCEPFIIDIFSLMLRYKLTPELAASQFVKHLWKPNIGSQYPQLTMQLLRVIASADWHTYYSYLDNLFICQQFKVPAEFLTFIAKDAVAKNQPAIIQKALKLLLFSSIKYKNELELHSVIEILQQLQYCQQAHQQLEQPQQQEQQLQQLQQVQQLQPLQFYQQQPLQQQLQPQVLQLMLQPQQQHMQQQQLQVEPLLQLQLLQQLQQQQQQQQEHELQQQLQLQQQHLQQQYQQQQQQLLPPIESLTAISYNQMEQQNVNPLLLPF